MIRFENRRESRGSLRVSMTSGSPIAASIRSAALAYARGSSRQSSRYSPRDISSSRAFAYVSRYASNRFMVPPYELLLFGFAFCVYAKPQHARVNSNRNACAVPCNGTSLLWVYTTTMRMRVSPDERRLASDAECLARTSPMLCGSSVRTAGTPTVGEASPLITALAPAPHPGAHRTS